MVRSIALEKLDGESELTVIVYVVIEGVTVIVQVVVLKLNVQPLGSDGTVSFAVP